MNIQFKKILFVFKIVMGLIYVAIGLAMLFKPGAGIERFMAPQLVPFVAITLVAYGGFRIYRAYKLEKKEQV